MTTNDLAKKIYHASNNCAILGERISERLRSAQMGNVDDLMLEFAGAMVNRDDLLDSFRLALAREETGATVA